MSTEFATRAHKGERFLFLMGFTMVVTSIGLALAPHYSWQVTKLARLMATLGLHNGALLVGGLVLVGLWIVARVASSATPVPDQRAEYEALQSELNLFNEQLTTRLAQIRASILQVQDAVNTVSAQQLAQLQSQSENPTPADQLQDAIFRLAASLDKLHAHLDERVHAVDLQLRSGFEALLNASHDVRRHIGHAPGSQAPEATASSHASHFQGPAAHGGIDFYETMQKLDAIAGSTDPQGHSRATHGRHPQAPLPSLGHDETLDVLQPEEFQDRY